MVTGETRSQLELPGRRVTCSASPVLAGGHLYVTSEEGTTYVMKVDGDQLTLVAESAIDDFVVATPVFLDGRIYLRADRYLHCIGNSQ